MTAGVSIASNRTIYSNVKDSTDEKTTAVKQKENNLNGTEKAAKDKEKELPYDQLIKRTGSVQDGLFTIRHIDDKWYFEIADSLLGRYILAVTRFTGVPQSFGKFSGEAINQQTLCFGIALLKIQRLLVNSFAPTFFRKKPTPTVVSQKR